MACAFVVCMITSAAVVSPSGATAPDGSGGVGQHSFCDPDRQARDFGFAALLPVHELDESTSGRELGHPHVTVYGGLQEVRPVTRPGKVGFHFFETGSPDPVFVHWTVTETLWAVDAHGEHAVEVGHAGLVVDPINLQHEPGPTIGIAPPARLGFYRYDLRIIQRGETIGTYSAYLKLVRPSSRARLLLGHRIVPAGGRIPWRLENLGSEQVDYGEEFKVERKQGGAWTHVRGFGEGVWSLVTLILEPGATGGCETQRLPWSLPPGRYRIVQEAELFRWPKVKPDDVMLKAPFTVVTPDR